MAHFGVRNPGWSAPARVVLPVWFSALWVWGCTPRHTPGPVEDSLTSGRISVVCAPEARPLIERETAAFQALYPAAGFRVVSGPSREAVRALFAAQCDLAVITRALEPEERAAAARGGLELEGYRFARDALVLIVHPSNPIENLALDQVRSIYLARTRRWEELGGPNTAFEPVIQPPDSDIMEFFMQQVMSGESIRARALYQASDSAVVDAVARRPGAIGFVSLARAADPRVRTLRVASLTGLPYWQPDLEAVYRGDYPLTRYLSFYVRTNGPRLANGFITFVTSFDGQKIVREQGLVPTTVPVRFVRSSPMQSTHRTGD